MKKIAFVFKQVPHGTSVGREGLDSVLATSALIDSIALFFIADGVWQLLPEQQPQRILARDYIATFGVLPLYDINACYICTDSLAQRAIPLSQPWIIEVIPLSAQQIAKKLTKFDIVLTF